MSISTFINVMLSAVLQLSFNAHSFKLYNLLICYVLCHSLPTDKCLTLFNSTLQLLHNISVFNVGFINKHSISLSFVFTSVQVMLSDTVFHTKYEFEPNHRITQFYSKSV